MKKVRSLLLALPLVLVGVLYFAPQTLADSSGPLNPGTEANDATVGTVDWTLTRAGSSNDSYDIAAGLTATISENSIILVQGGVQLGPSNDKSTGASLTKTDTYYQYGGAADLWGMAWDVSNVNGTGFGVKISVRGSGATSKYLYVSNFGFAIPAGSTINGVLAEAEMSVDTATQNDAQVDHVRITVTYTLAGVPDTQTRAYYWD